MQGHNRTFVNNLNCCSFSLCLFNLCFFCVSFFMITNSTSYSKAIQTKSFSTSKEFGENVYLKEKGLTRKYGVVRGRRRECVMIWVCRLDLKMLNIVFVETSFLFYKINVLMFNSQMLLKKRFYIYIFHFSLHRAQLKYYFMIGKLSGSSNMYLHFT